MRRINRLLCGRVLAISPRAQATRMISRPRFIHSTKFCANKPIENAAQEDQAESHFSEMMDDRTNALLQSLGISANQFKESEPTKDTKETKKHTSVPLVAAIDVNSPTVASKVAPQTHFFDTQDVYSELRSAGLTPGQAEVIMRTMQELIHELVRVCKDRSVPVAAGANEAYLFDAASSEVRNEISNSRQSQATTYRSGLARLQRDVEILEHEATEMTSLLKSDLDIEVHERKNATRAEENVIQLKVQELNNKISTRLNSDLKSEIENLRWQITRRSLTAIAVVVALFIWLTQTNTRTKTAKTQERQRQSVGTSIPVPVLAPSMATTEEPYDHSATSIPVEDLSSIVGTQNTDASTSYGDNASKSQNDADTSTNGMSSSQDGSSGTATNSNAEQEDDRPVSNIHSGNNEE